MFSRRLAARSAMAVGIGILLFAGGFCAAQDAAIPARPDRVSTKTYPVGELLGRWKAEELVRAVTTLVAPGSWQPVGKVGMVAVRGKTSLVVTQNERSHRLIDRLLKRLALIRDDNPTGLSPAEQKIERTLASPTQVEFIETPLSDVVAYLQDYHEIEIRIDKKALDDRRVPADVPITKDLAGISLRSALALTLGELDLTCYNANGVLLITTPEEAQVYLTAKVYPVGDLLSKEENRRREERELLVRLLREAISQPRGERPGRWFFAAPSPPEFTPSVTIIGSPGTHEFVGSLLARLRTAINGKPGNLTKLSCRHEEKIEKALASPTELQFIETPLSDVVDCLKDYHKIEIQIDKKALDDVGVGTDVPVTADLEGISLRSALALTLRGLELTYVIQDEVLLITTPEAAGERLATRVYPLKKSLAVDALSKRDAQRFVEIVKACVQPGRWAGSGGTGTIAIFPGGKEPLLAVTQTHEVHEEIAALLEMFRRRGQLGTAERKILERLDTVTRLDFIETPLSDVAEYLRDCYDIEVQIDKRCLDDVGVDTNDPITCDLSDVTLRSALRLILRELDLTYVVLDEVLLITVAKDSQSQRHTRVYPVDDLGAVDPDSLAKTIRKAMARAGWRASGGKGVIMPAFADGPKCLVVWQNYATHERLAEVLRCLRVIAKEEVKKGEEKSPEEKIRVALRSATEIDAGEVPFRDLLDFWQDYHHIGIQTDGNALAAAGMENDTLVPGQFQDVPLRSALQRLLAKRKLAFIVRDEQLLITAPETAANWSSTRVYPVSAAVEEQLARQRKRFDPELLVPLGQRKALVLTLPYAEHEKAVALLGPPVPRRRIKPPVQPRPRPQPVMEGDPFAPVDDPEGADPFRNGGTDPFRGGADPFGGAPPPPPPGRLGRGPVRERRVSSTP